MPRAFTLLVVIGVLAFVPGAAEAKQAPRRTITVMTQNLYLGANLDPIVKAKSIPEAFRAVEAAWALVQANDFPARARAVALEIARARPDFVGLQELSLYRLGPPGDISKPSAATVTLDYLREIKAALRERGLHYRVVGVNAGTDAELPSGYPAKLDIRLTVRDALLVERGIRVGRVRRGLYRSTHPLFAGLVTAKRGWVSADATVGGRTVRVITTHLESFDDPTQVKQGQEILSGPARTRLPVVLLGDLNSRADGTGTPTRANLLAAGFRDAWSQAYPDEPGLTCCHGDDLREPGGPFYSRIDLVLTRGGFRGLRGAVVGELPQSRTPNGLWPSDHGGFWMTLRLPAT